jgi:hypothetical protein
MTAMSPTRRLIALMLVAPMFVSTLPGCAVCKSSDTYEQCRTKERNHSQPRVELYLGIL